jgi:hypothetical protein
MSDLFVSAGLHLDPSAVSKRLVWMPYTRTWSGRGEGLVWAVTRRNGGIIALHDTILPIDKTEQSELGSHKYFRSEIQQDPRFEIVGQQDSLSVLNKR